MDKYIMKGFELYEHTFEFFLRGSEKEVKEVNYYDQAELKFLPYLGFDHYYKIKRVDVENQLEYLLNNGIVYEGEARNVKRVKHVEKDVYGDLSPFYVLEETLDDKIRKPFSKLFGISLNQNEYKIPIEVIKKVWKSSSGNKPTYNVKMLKDHTKITKDGLEIEQERV